MKRLSVYLFLMLIVICFSYGFGYSMFSQKQGGHTQITKKQEVTTTISQNKKTTQKQVSTEANTNDALVDPVQRNIENNEKQFFIKYQEQKVVVYQKDQKTIYEETDIDDSQLTTESKKQLKNGIWVKNEEELYALLESYSS